MANQSDIEWTDATWNPVTGCNKVSPGCKFCYAEKMAKRLNAMGSYNYRNGFDVTLQPQILEHPLKWKKTKHIFVNSMSDLFHEKVEFEYIEKVFEVMKKAYWHRFQILTKRSERLKKLAPRLDWPENVWMGVSVEKKEYLYRINDLREVPAAVRFLSLEPLLGSLVGLSLEQIHWVIVGGESGPGARPMEEEWVLQIKDTCEKENVPFFFKQWGGVNKKKTGRLLLGKTWDNMPDGENTEVSHDTKNIASRAS